ncbi:hypothetical protein NA57DRAFT_58995 [Rhizodiscina lignyota]|uniref:DUF7730 domain-containing protein n=1 Tax=Rhizodiscina lignyota TaxID=1504668 RepID=A0A9P4I6K4_9PEZI|nr:hypothetical protein NA57DRAFT_58995 [Rhizodiscina lignyota]
MSSLLALPRELRDIVYHYALVSGDALEISCPTVRTLQKCICRHLQYTSALVYHYCNLPFTDIARTKSPTRPNVALLRTCRQIYAEAAKLPYERNTFHFVDQQCEAEEQIVGGRKNSRIRSTTIAEHFLRNLPAAHLLQIKTLSLEFLSPNWPIAFGDFAAQSLQLEELILSFAFTMSDTHLRYWPDVRVLPWEGHWAHRFSEPQILLDRHAKSIFDMCKIKNLKGLAINIKLQSVLGYPEARDRTVQSAAAFCSLLQSKMLNDEARLALVESTFHGRIAFAYALTGNGDTPPFSLHVHADAGRIKSIPHRQPRTQRLLVTEQFELSRSDARMNYLTCPVCSGEASLAAQWEAKLESMEFDLTDLHVQSWPEGLADADFVRHIYGEHPGAGSGFSRI